jgi:hypothetical protein
MVVCEAIRLVLTQFLLKDMRLGVIEGAPAPLPRASPSLLPPRLTRPLTSPSPLPPSINVPGQYVLSPASAGCLFAMSLFVEVPTMIKTGSY